MYCSCLTVANVMLLGLCYVSVVEWNTFIEYIKSNTVLTYNLEALVLGVFLFYATLYLISTSSSYAIFYSLLYLIFTSFDCCLQAKLPLWDIKALLYSLHLTIHLFFTPIRSPNSV